MTDFPHQYVVDARASAEGPVALVPCTGEPCTRASHCLMRDVWQDANDAVVGIFRGTKLSDLVKKAHEQHSWGYEI